MPNEANLKNRGLPHFFFFLRISLHCQLTRQAGPVSPLSVDAQDDTSYTSASGKLRNPKTTTVPRKPLASGHQCIPALAKCLLLFLNSNFPDFRPPGSNLASNSQVLHHSPLFTCPSSTQNALTSRQRPTDQSPTQNIKLFPPTPHLHLQQSYPPTG